MPDFSHTVLPDWFWLLAQILLILVVAWLALRYARGFVHGIFRTLVDREATEGGAQDVSSIELRKRMDTLDGLGAGILRFIIVVIAGLMILGRLGIDIGPAIAGLGIAGIAVGFGAQSLVKDYFNGALILIENQYTKGDVVKIAGVEGTVEDLTLRRTTLRDFEGNVHTVPNSATVVTTNLTRGWARITEELKVPSSDLVEAASDAVADVGREMADDPVWHGRLLEPPHVERIDELGPTGITLRIAARVQASHRWTATGEVRRRLLHEFQVKGLPFVPGSGVDARAGSDPGAMGHVDRPPAAPGPPSGPTLPPDPTAPAQTMPAQAAASASLDTTSASRPATPDPTQPPV